MSAVARLYEKSQISKLDMVINNLQHAFYKFGIGKESKLMRVYLISLLENHEAYATEIIQEYKRLKKEVKYES